jgi:hypothetical protein
MTGETNDNIESTILGSMEKTFDNIQGRDETAAPDKKEEVVEGETQDDQIENTEEVTEDKTEENLPTDKTDQKAGVADKTAKAPATWTAEEKAEFSKLPPTVQSAIARRESDREKAFHQKTSEFSEVRKTLDRYDQVITPYKAMIAAEGGTPDRAIAELLQTAALFRTGTPEMKLQAIQQIATQFGVPLDRLGNVKSEEFSDPEIAALKSELHQVKGFITSERNQKAQVEQKQSDEAVLNFKADPKNKYFAEVANDMADLVEMGKAKDLPDAYEKACRLNPEVFEKIQADAKAEAEKKRIEANELAAKKAKKAAGVNLSTTRDIVNGKARFDDKVSLEQNLERTMERVYDDVAAR